MRLSRLNGGIHLAAAAAIAALFVAGNCQQSLAQATLIAAQSFEGNSTTIDVFGVDFEGDGLDFGDFAIDPDGPGGDAPVPGFSVNPTSQLEELVPTGTFNDLLFITFDDGTTSDGAEILEFTQPAGQPATGRVFDGPATQTVTLFNTITTPGDPGAGTQPVVDPASPTATAPSIPWTLNFVNSRFNDALILNEVADELNDYITDVEGGLIAEAVDITTGNVTLRTLPAGFPGTATPIVADDLGVENLPVVLDESGLPTTTVFDAAGGVPGPATPDIPPANAVPDVTLNGATLETSFVNLFASAVNGDYNFDGVVNAADYTITRERLGQDSTTGTQIINPFNGDILLVGDSEIIDISADPPEPITNLSVGQEDLDAWISNFGEVTTDFVDIDGVIGGLSGPEGGDTIGVVSDPLLIQAQVGPGGTATLGTSLTPFDGDNLLLINDSDGAILLELDPVDVSAFTDVGVLFDFIVNDTGFESGGAAGSGTTSGSDQPDQLAVFANGTLIFQIVDTANSVWDPATGTLVQDTTFGLEALDGVFLLDSLISDLDALITDGTLQLTFALDSSSGAENIAFDNIRIFGTSIGSAIPEPSTLAIVTAAALGWVGRRRVAG